MAQMSQPCTVLSTTVQACPTRTSGKLLPCTSGWEPCRRAGGSPQPSASHQHLPSSSRPPNPHMSLCFPSHFYSLTLLRTNHIFLSAENWLYLQPAGLCRALPAFSEVEFYLQLTSPACFQPGTQPSLALCCMQPAAFLPAANTSQCFCSVHSASAHC